MLEPTASRFWQAALQSGLADAQALQTCWDAIPAEKRVAEHVDRRLARQAVQTGVLTLWQAQQLIAGRSTGFKIDRYVLLDLLGQGGMGRVYLALDSRLNRRVALKILSPERVNNPRAKARFHREALVGAQLQQENLVRIYDEGEAQGKCYLVMEYIEGKNIGQMIAENGPLPPAVAARLVRQVALGLEHAQRKGLIHRDVNPYNILVTRDGVAKLTDMGLAIDLADQDRVTRDGATVGTFDYVSPEQARHSHSVDTRSDIYSLGCTLYHMLTGQVPFPCVSLPEKLFSHQTSEPEPVTKLAPEVPEELGAIVSKMMRKLPDERYSTPLELAQTLEPFADVVSGAGSEAGGGSSRSGTRLAATMTQISTPPSDGEASPTIPTLDPVLSMGPSPAPVLPTPMPASPTVPVSPPQFVTPSTNSNDGLLGMGISVDLGPEPPLSRSNSNSGRSKVKAGAAAAKTGGARASWVVPVASGVGVFALGIVGAMAYRTLAGGGAAASPAPAVAIQSEKADGPDAHSRPRSKRKAAETAEGVETADKGNEIAVVDSEGTTTVATFAAAVQRAIGGRGHILLRNRSPVKIPAEEALQAAGGNLVIRAAEGIKPVLEVEVKGDKPFLFVRTDATLRIERVTIAVKYVDLEKTPQPAAVIECGGKVDLDRCSFRVEGMAPGTRALAVEGGTLTATGCWFESFDRAVELSCFAGTAANLNHCMFIRPRSEEPESSSSALIGWSVRLRSMPGEFDKTRRKLVIDHCTAQGSGFLDFAGFSSEAPMMVDISAAAVVADALISWGPGVPFSERARAAGVKEASETAPLTREALVWTGRNNQYDIRGKSWVLLAPATAMPNGPVDLDTWSKQIGDENDPFSPPVRFATDASAISEHPQPKDFAVKVTTTPAKHPGADPAFVGPGGRPIPPKPKR